MPEVTGLELNVSIRVSKVHAKFEKESELWAWSHWETAIVSQSFV